MPICSDQTTAAAMLCEKPGAGFVLHNFPLPKPKRGEVLVKNIFSTICTSDLHTCLGRRVSPLPSVLGHEIIGEVVSLPEVPILDYFGQPIEKGDLLTWTVYAHDSSDEWAKRGIPQKSPSLFKYGHEKAVDVPTTLSGGFASHCLLRQGTSLFQLPKELTPAEAAPLNCTHATIAGAIRLAGNLKGKKILVSGSGMLGLSACAMVKEAGASTVWAIDPQPNRQVQARQFGADYSIGPGELTTELKADVLIETSGIPEAMERGLLHLAVGGIAVWVGAVFTQRDLAINAELVVRNILTIKGLHNYAPQDLAQAIKFLKDARTKYPFHDLVSIQYPLVQLDEAVQVADSGLHYRVGIYPNEKIT
jgi:putative phosphonate catabolism associated alcohol dehydrogenase